MKTRIALAVTTLFALVAGMLMVMQPAHAATGFYVSGGKLYDANGNPFVMRGVSHAHTWYPSQTGSFANIKALGANTVRVVLSSGDRWTRNTPSDVANVVSLCKANRLICVLEVHDTTGYGEDSAAVPLSKAVDYWLSLADVLNGQERYVIINLGNEPYGNQNYGTWTTDTIDALMRLRAAGFHHTLMVDAPNWGQDWTFTMRDNASKVFDADRNTIFSIHMYGVFDTAAEITDYLGRFRTAGLPIVVGEFGDRHSDGDVDEDTIMSYSQANGIGYLGWSWSGNGGGVEYLDMVTNFNPSQLTSWGQRIFNGANGIKQTAKEATVYLANPPTGTPTGLPTGTPTTRPTSSTLPPAAGCTASYAITGQWPGGFQAEVKVTPSGSLPLRGWTVSWSFANGQKVTQFWNANVASLGAEVTARNVQHNGTVPVGTSASFGFLGTWTGTNSVPTLRCSG
ncbi:cellulase family glycosylhydrolase [Micromonospora zhanjiangensis]|uniref:Endoglucanase n=1 Tax=Micromonospora zhanjiangensis TaxID=1522057 RepID=A0ABV8KUE5_9ACTN